MAREESPDNIGRRAPEMGDAREGMVAGKKKTAMAACHGKGEKVR